MSDSLETIAMQMISYAGDAKADGYSALHAAKKKNFDEADRLMKTADEKITTSHQIHLKLLGIKDQFKNINEQLLITHAMDTMMTATAELDLINEIVDILKEKAR